MVSVTLLCISEWGPAVVCQLHPQDKQVPDSRAFSQPFSGTAPIKRPQGQIAGDKGPTALANPVRNFPGAESELGKGKVLQRLVLGAGSENGDVRVLVAGPTSARAELRVAVAPARSSELLARHLLPQRSGLGEETIGWIRAKGHGEDHKGSAQEPYSPATLCLTEISGDRGSR